MDIRYLQGKAKEAIVLPSWLIEKFEIIPHRLILNIGGWSKEVSVEFSEEMENEIGIYEDMFENFKLPVGLPYEIAMVGRTLQLGPVICFAIVSRKNSLTPEVLEKFKSYYLHYAKIKGLFYLCAAEGINCTNHTIEGVYLRIDEDTGESKWEEGVFPYPGAMYRRAGFTKEAYDDLINLLGDKIFNGYFFDKWELWEYFSNIPILKEHLPYSVKLESFEILDLMLKKYPSVYLKRASGYKAKGIVKVHKSPEGYHFAYRLKGEMVLNNPEDIINFLSELNEHQDYMVQEAIPVKQYQERHFDFRVILQKDGSMKWGCTGIIARFGKIGSIATNFLLAGYALTGQEALRRVFDLNEKEVFLKEQEIINLCIKACQTLDKSVGHYGDLGIDVIVDGNLKVWILEINKLHDHKFPLYSIDDKLMYYKLVTNPLEYAKSLAGFTKDKIIT